MAEEPIPIDKCSRPTELGDLSTLSWTMQGDPGGNGATLIVRCRCGATLLFQPEAADEFGDYVTLELDCGACEVDRIAALRGWTPR